MDARRLLKRMCQRHGLPLQGSVRLLSLIERALISPADVRDRILTLVDGNLARRARSPHSATPEQVHVELDEEVLLSVGRVLHGWTPSSKVLHLGQVLPDLFPEGFGPEEID